MMWLFLDGETNKGVMVMYGGESGERVEPIVALSIMAYWICCNPKKRTLFNQFFLVVATPSNLRTMTCVETSPRFHARIVLLYRSAFQTNINNYEDTWRCIMTWRRIMSSSCRIAVVVSCLLGSQGCESSTSGETEAASGNGISRESLHLNSCSDEDKEDEDRMMEPV